MPIKNLACVVVIYNPSACVADNIASYINEIDQFFLVDNSIMRNDELLKNLISHKKVTYIHEGTNKGIAYALNKGCTEAINNGCEWILTMDQDSKFINFNGNSITKYINGNESDIAVFFPQYLINGKLYDKLFKYNGKSFITMTSGNLMNLRAYNCVGKFNEDLFIDFVDIDYCLRIRAANYAIKMMDDITLMHGLGKVDYRNLFGKKIIVTNHNYLRRYYITRNRFFIINKYERQFPYYTRIENKLFFNDLFKIILFESDKLRKIWSIIKGYNDYKKGKYGEYKIK